MLSILPPNKRFKYSTESLLMKEIYDLEGNKFVFYMDEKNQEYIKKVFVYFPSGKLKQEIYISYHILQIKNSCDECKHLDEYFAKTYKWFTPFHLGKYKDSEDYVNNWPIDLQEAPYCDKCFRFKANNTLILQIIKKPFEKIKFKPNLELDCVHPEFVHCNHLLPDKYFPIEKGVINDNFVFQVYWNRVYNDVDYSTYFISRNENKPSYIEYNEEGEIVREIWTKDGIIHRDDGPAMKIIDDTTKYEVYCKMGKIHRDNDPAILHYYLKENDEYELEDVWYYKNGYAHREDGPSNIEYTWDEEGLRTVHKFYYLYGCTRIPRKDGGASYEVEREDGRTFKQWWYYENCYDPPYHRIGGPSNVGYWHLTSSIDDEDDPPVEEYYLYGQKYSKERYNHIMKCLKSIAKRWKNKKRYKIYKILDENCFSCSDINNFICKLI
jgi:hypothetical protein